MRPLKLTMSAFCSYAEKTVLELDKLGKDGIYLITGDTGAGKTTIFDAISFALFDEPSGDVRGTSTLRSKYALPSTPTEVELVFEYDNKEYTVTRNPEYQRAKTRGEGMTNVSANATLHCPDGRIISKKTEVDKAIIEILGVDKDQFSQIAMIAQGDFQKLILAPTSERSAIFRKIFNTKFYADLQERLKSEASKLNSEYALLTASITQYINGVQCDEKAHDAVRLESAKNRKISLEETIELIELLISNDKEAEKDFDEKIELLDKDIEEISKIIAQAERYQNALKDMEKYSSNLEKAKADLEIIAKAKAIQEAEKPKAEELSNKISKIESKLPEYDELEDKKREQKDLEIAVSMDVENLESKNESLKDLTQEIENLKQEKSNLENSTTERLKLETQKSELEKNLTALGNLEAEINALSVLEEKLASAQNEYKKASEDAEGLKNEYDAKYKAYLDEQAGIIASGLCENQPCPVCGSVVHPKLAKISENAPTKAELDKLKKAFEKAQKDASKKSETAGKAKGAVEEKKSAVEKLRYDLLGEMDIAKAIEKKAELKEKIDEFKKQIDIQIKNEKRKETLEKLIPEKETALDALNKAINTAKERLTTNKANLESITQRIAEYKQKLKYESKTEAQNIINTLSNEKTKLEKAIEKAIKDFAECEKSIDILTAKIEETKKLLSDVVEVNIEEKTEKKTVLLSEKTSIMKKRDVLKSRLSSNISALDNILLKSESIKNVKSKLTWVESLSNTANGTIGNGRYKIKLETYIQSTYFDRIIAKANKRFSIMTGGQYDLIRHKSTDGDSKQKQTGLELDVINHHNGSILSVSSLSGGEKFKASLSLALGLSDEIQSSAGGIKLDTMFVDEGFGTLDEESLRQAMDALYSLSSNNRLVGIISHVAELKEKIDKQIIITKEKIGGSKAEIVINS